MSTVRSIVLLSLCLAGACSVSPPRPVAIPEPESTPPAEASDAAGFRADRAPLRTFAAGSAVALPAGFLAAPVDLQRRTPPNRRRTAGFAEFAVGLGEYDFHDEFLGRDDSAATMLRMRGGVASSLGIGGGLDVKLFLPHDNVYDRSLVETSFHHFDIFPHFLALSGAGRFRMPLRIGPYLSGLRAEFERSGDRTDYISLGARFELQPEVVLFQNRRGDEGSVYARISAGAHGTAIDDESTDEDYESSGSTFGFETGFRFTVRRVSMSIAYLFDHASVRESDIERNRLVIPRLDTDFQGLQMTFGVRF